MTALAPISDQRRMLLIVRELEVPPVEEVRESELVQEASNADIKHPGECITALIATGHVYRVKAPSGIYIRRTEK